MEDYFTFRKMVSHSFIKVIYVLGLIVISIAGISSIIKGADQRYGGEILVLTGLGTLLFGNLIWRVLCEAWIIIFSIHDKLVSVDNILQAEYGVSFTKVKTTPLPQESVKEHPIEKDAVCKSCGVKVELGDSEIKYGFFICPNCGERNDLGGGSSQADNPGVATTAFKVSKTDPEYIVCLNCGQENFNTYKFCQKCGRRFVG